MRTSLIFRPTERQKDLNTNPGALLAQMASTCRAEVSCVSHVLTAVLANGDDAADAAFSGTSSPES